jgi:hypothetical protein
MMYDIASSQEFFWFWYTPPNKGPGRKWTRIEFRGTNAGGRLQVNESKNGFSSDE